MNSHSNSNRFAGDWGHDEFAFHHHSDCDVENSFSMIVTVLRNSSDNYISITDSFDFVNSVLKIILILMEIVDEREINY